MTGIYYMGVIIIYINVQNISLYTC